MAKYEIKIRISSEEVFRMLARYAPWELVDVEELPPNPLPKAPPSVKALANHLKRISSVKFDSVAQVRKMRTGKGVDLRRGMALAVMTALRDGQEHTTAELIKSLEKHGFKTVPSVSNKFMVDTRRPAMDVITAMRKEKVYIGRPWPVWPTSVRVTVGTKDEMAKFQAAWLKVMA